MLNKSGLLIAAVLGAAGIPTHMFSTREFSHDPLAGINRGKRYMPHQGKRECARRMRQIAAGRIAVSA